MAIGSPLPVVLENHHGPLEIATELGGCANLYFHYGVLKFPQGFLRIEFLNLGRMAQVRKEGPISGPLVFCGCHSDLKIGCH